MDNQNALLILGDFNYDVTLDRNADVKATVENYHNLMHIVTEPTFQNTTGTSTIDNAFTNVNQYDSSVIECPYSDHRILALALSV
jgi:endonuclease/exonuclease/phosphatase family metal-dependent hydrolase